MTTNVRHVCARQVCNESVAKAGKWCSDLCARIDAALAACPTASGPMTLGYGAAVAQAGPLTWLDVRVEAS